MLTPSLKGNKGKLFGDWGTMLFLASGYALCRVCAEVPLGIAGFQTPWEEAGKVVGLLSMLACILLSDRMALPRQIEFLPEAFLVVGCALSVACPLAEPGPLGCISAAIIGLGTATAMVMWLESFGMLPARRIVVCLALAYILEVPVGFMSSALEGTAAAPVMLCLATAIAVWARSARQRDPEYQAMALLRPRKVNGLDTLVPWHVVAWILASGVSFGIMEIGSLGSVAGSGMDIVGRSVPCLLVVGFYLAAPERFDLRFLYGLTLPLLMAGLSLAGSMGTGSGNGALLFCMGAAATRLVSYFSVCSAASSRSVSSLFGCTCVMLLNVMARNAGVFISSTSMFVSFSEVFLTLAVVVTSATVVIFLMVELGDKPDAPEQHADPADEDSPESETDRLIRLASEKGLSPREEDVFMRMIAGDTNAQIGDVLFISAGAVRSHTSRIYEKFGVHSRQELEQAVLGE